MDGHGGPFCRKGPWLKRPTQPLEVPLGKRDLLQAFRRVGTAAILLWFAFAVRVLHAAEPVTFNRQIAPILHQHCAGCHRPGGAGPFPLFTHRDAQKHAARIREVVAGEEMPPWKAVGDHGEFVGDRRLSEDQKRLIDRWIAEGCLAGDRDQFPFPPLVQEAWQLGEPDVVLRPTPLGSISLTTNGTTLLAIDLAQHDQWATAIEIHPRFIGFQHALLWLDLPLTSEVREVDDAGQAVRRTQLLPSWIRDRLLAPAPSALLPAERAAAVAARDRRLVGVWAYDCLAQTFPEGTAFCLPARARLIVEMPVVKSDALSTPLEIGLHLATEPPQRMVAVAAVEAAASGVGLTRESPRQGAFQVPVDCELHLLAPHADAACKEVRVGATLPDGRSESLLWIDRWNPRWETAYQYRRPLQVPARSRLDVQFLAAASRAADLPAASGPTLVAAQLVPAHPADYDELVRAMQRAQMSVARLPVQNSRVRR